MPADHAPRVLVADDDAATRCFFENGLRQLGVQTVLCSDGSTALRRARAELFDLLLLDYRMPDIDAIGVLASLRRDATALSAHSPAIASSADLGPAEQRAFLAAGFRDVLPKPCTLADLRNALRCSSIAITLPVLDDGQALIASGTPAVLQALRGLFRQELLTLCVELDALSADAVLFEARLHKLRSSCGFCGATALAERIASLQQRLKQANRRPADQRVSPWLEDFRHAVLETLQALGEKLETC